MRSLSLYLMTDKGYSVLESLVNTFDPNSINAVVSFKDRSSLDRSYLSIQDYCRNVNIPFFDKSNYVFENSKDTLNFAIGWKWMLPSDNTVVFHDSLLPKYRGFNPLVSMLINAEPKIGVTALHASKYFDSGPIIAQSSIDISYPMKINTAIELISPIYATLAVDIAKKWFSGQKIKSFPQNDSDASYSVWRDKQDYFIDWSQSSDKIQRTVDASGFPYAGSKTIYQNNLITLDEVQTFPDLTIENRSYGKILMKNESAPVVICGSGLLSISSARYEDGSMVNFNTIRERLG